MRMLNPEWEERELQEIEDAKRLGASIHKADVETNGKPERLYMHVPAWWDTWQTFLSEIRTHDLGERNTEDLAQITYERAWADAVKTIEAAIKTATKGSD